MNLMRVQERRWEFPVKHNYTSEFHRQLNSTLFQWRSQGGGGGGGGGGGRGGGGGGGATAPKSPQKPFSQKG
jgi:uncharacterized membrane protein